MKEQQHINHTQLDAVLCAKWTAHGEIDKIVGRWNHEVPENDVTYIIMVPPELRQQIILMQNSLYNISQQLKELSSKLENTKNFMDRILGNK